MTVDVAPKRPRVVNFPSHVSRCVLLLMLGAASATIASRAGAQRKPNPAAPPWADSIGESEVYPTGDAVGVYRAVLDLLYVDGNERPSYILLLDTARRQSGGPCPFACKQEWLHKSKIDTATILAYARPSRKSPRIIDFRYKIPIVHTSQDAFERITNDGYGYLADRPPDKVGALEAFWAGFRRKYPRAWGYVMLGKVGFNPQHTEALIGVYQVCGENCRSFESIFLKRFGKRWSVIERVPEYAEAYQTSGNQRYRGPAGERQDQSQLVAIDSRGSPPRPESGDAAKVYRAVLDSLYSFRGESPQSLVITETRAYDMTDLKAFRSRIDSSTIASFNFYSRVHDGFYPRFRYRKPITWIGQDAIKNLEREGVPLTRVAVERMEDEQSPIWLAFHARYPRAWGYASLGRPGFNPRHTQALVLAQHFCGTSCVNTDAWFLARKGERWHVVERLAGDNQAALGTEGLRYLGRDADPRWYRPRRVQGVISNALTGEPLPSLDVAVYRQNKYFHTFRTDSAGRYTLEDLPMNGGMLLKVRCPIAARSDSLYGGDFGTRPGMDTTINVALDYRFCLHLNRAHPLIARWTRSGAVIDPTYPMAARAPKSDRVIDVAHPSPADEAVYLGVLRALYPSGAYESGRIMLQAFTRASCNDCVDAETPRLVRSGAMDASTETNFARLPKEPVRLRPLAPYRRKLEVMAPEDRELFSGTEEWDAIKDAYPGVRALVGFSRVGFNDSATTALVEVHTDSARASGAAEIMLLRRIGAEWRATLRHVEREATSGEWSAGRCEPGEAPGRGSNVAEIENLHGDFEIVRVGASREFRGRTDSLRIRLDALGPSPRKGRGLVARAATLDASDKPEEKIAGTLEANGSSAAITFSRRLPEGMVQLDGWVEQYFILRTNGREFFGTWSTSNGPTVPLEGYFCARPAPGR